MFVNAAFFWQYRQAVAALATVNGAHLVKNVAVAVTMTPFIVVYTVMVILRIMLHSLPSALLRHPSACRR